MNYCLEMVKDFDEQAEHRAKDYFEEIVTDDQHVLHHLLPPAACHSYNMHSSSDKYGLPVMCSAHDDRNFVVHMCYSVAGLH